MNRYDFFIEYNGRSISSQDYTKSFDEVMSNNFDKAISKFSSRHKIKLVSYDVLDDSSYRAFFEKKAFMKKPVEYIFHVQITAV